PAKRFGARLQFAGNLGSPRREVVVNVEVDASKLHPAHFTDGISEHCRPAANAAAKNHLERFSLALVGPLINDRRHPRFRLSVPYVALEHAEPHDTQSVQANVAIISFADMPREDAFAVIVCRRLGKRAGTWDAAIAGVEPISCDAPARNFRHKSLR